jgi:hypothetical protein
MQAAREILSSLPRLRAWMITPSFFDVQERGDPQRRSLGGIFKHKGEDGWRAKSGTRKTTARYADFADAVRAAFDEPVEIVALGIIGYMKVAGEEVPVAVEKILRVISPSARAGGEK